MGLCFRQAQGHLQLHRFLENPGKNVVLEEDHVLAPAQVPSWGTVEVRFDELGRVGVQLLGRPDHLGLKVASRDGHVEIFPRLCAHEGACLDAAPRLDSGVTMCPWHGRKLKPLLRFREGERVGSAAGPMHLFDIREDRLLITCKDPLPDPNLVDWSRPDTVAIDAGHSLPAPWICRPRRHQEGRDDDARKTIHTSGRSDRADA